jgi:O-glycosyl hydrolase
VEVVQTTWSLSQRMARLPDVHPIPVGVRCAGAQLTASAGPKLLAAGRYAQTVRLRNVSRRPCTLAGYPRLQLLSRRGRALNSPIRHGANGLFHDFGPSEVVLAPSAVGSFAFGGANRNLSRRTPCLQAQTIEVSPPGASTAGATPAPALRRPVPICASGLYVSAVGLGADSASLSAFRLPTVAIDPRRRYQRVNGVGAALTDSSAWLIYDELAPLTRAQLMSQLYGPAGINLAFTLIPMGASDFTQNGVPYTYDDLPPGHTDPSLSGFSIAHDKSYIIPLLQQIRALDPQLKLLAVPWTAPPWMKANQAYDDFGPLGTLLAADYTPLAAYFVRFLEAYAANGVPIGSIAPDNEPDAAAPFPGMSFPELDEANWVTHYLQPALSAAGLAPKIYGYDAGWQSDVYAQALLSGPSRAALAGIAWHCYHGTPNVMSTIRALDPQVDQLVAECSPGLSPYAVPSLLIGALRNWASSVAVWNLALDPSGGPVEPPNAGCRGCTGVVSIDETSGQVTLGRNYYELGQLGHFIQPGARRIASPSFATFYHRTATRPYNGVSAGLADVALRNPDGSEVLFAFNTASTSIPFTVTSGGRAFSYVLAPRATVTFVWDRAS